MILLPLAGALSVRRATVEHVQESLVGRAQDPIRERPCSCEKPRLDVKAKPRLIAEACSGVPEGRTRLTIINSRRPAGRVKRYRDDLR